MLLIRYHDNWADEMDITGFVIVTEENWSTILNVMQEFCAVTPKWTFDIGTDEEIEYYGFDHWFGTLNVASLDDNETATMVTLCQRVGMSAGYPIGLYRIHEGFFPLPSSYRLEKANLKLSSF